MMNEQEHELITLLRQIEDPDRQLAILHLVIDILQGKEVDMDALCCPT